MEKSIEKSMEQAEEIKIINCTNELAWYKDHVGEVMGFYNTDKDTEGNLYYTVDPDTREEGSIVRYVMNTDCEIVNE